MRYRYLFLFFCLFSGQLFADNLSVSDEDQAFCELAKKKYEQAKQRQCIEGVDVTTGNIRCMNEQSLQRLREGRREIMEAACDL